MIPFSISWAPIVATKSPPNFVIRLIVWAEKLIRLTSIYVDNIRDALTELDPEAELEQPLSEEPAEGGSEPSSGTEGSGG